jgi:hypothetical protein
MKKIIIALICLFLISFTFVMAAVKDLEIQGKKFISSKPPFTRSVLGSGLEISLLTHCCLCGHVADCSVADFQMICNLLERIPVFH